MTHFLRLLAEPDKAAALLDACERARRHEADPRRFEVAPESFDAASGKPFVVVGLSASVLFGENLRSKPC